MIAVDVARIERVAELVVLLRPAGDVAGFLGDARGRAKAGGGAVGDVDFAAQGGVRDGRAVVRRVVSGSAADDVAEAVTADVTGGEVQRAPGTPVPVMPEAEPHSTAVSPPKASLASAVPGTPALFWLSTVRLADDTPVEVP
jgi:hypothetical protein